MFKFNKKKYFKSVVSTDDMTGFNFRTSNYNQPKFGLVALQMLLVLALGTFCSKCFKCFIYFVILVGKKYSTACGPMQYSYNHAQLANKILNPFWINFENKFFCVNLFTGIVKDGTYRVQMVPYIIGWK